MELFYSDSIGPTSLRLTPDDSAHCARVLRHRAGDSINVVDGAGNLYECVITDDSPKAVSADIVNIIKGWHSHDYNLTMAVCPTKNNERFEWFVEKATEMGLDTISPVIGERSERKVYKTDRARKIVLSAAKQSLKAAFPAVDEPVSVREFIKTHGSGARYIAYCFENDEAPRHSLAAELADSKETEITILIGPEGDFSPAEAALALQHGYIPVHLGDSRLRTETAALTAAAMVYTSFIK